MKQERKTRCRTRLDVVILVNKSLSIGPSAKLGDTVIVDIATLLGKRLEENKSKTGLLNLHDRNRRGTHNFSRNMTNIFKVCVCCSEVGNRNVLRQWEIESGYPSLS